MKLVEFEEVKNLKYLEYCDYLQKKYGLSSKSYMSKNWVKTKGITRTAEGLIAHHKMENIAAKLSDVEIAKFYPYEWQFPSNIIYCDYLEHLFLHILICENSSDEKANGEIVGIGGIIEFIVPELNDVYSGWCSTKLWQINCRNKIKDDKDVYLLLLKRFKENCKDYPYYSDDCLYKSFNEQYGLWTKEKNKKIFNEIKNL